MIACASTATLDFIGVIYHIRLLIIGLIKKHQNAQKLCNQCILRMISIIAKPIQWSGLIIAYALQIFFQRSGMKLLTSIEFSAYKGPFLSSIVSIFPLTCVDSGAIINTHNKKHALKDMIEYFRHYNSIICGGGIKQRDWLEYGGTYQAIENELDSENESDSENTINVCTTFYEADQAKL